MGLRDDSRRHLSSALHELRILAELVNTTVLLIATREGYADATKLGTQRIDRGLRLKKHIPYTSANGENK
jgi:hypothetical protein